MFNFVDIEFLKMILVFRKEKKEKIVNWLVSLYVYFVIYEKGVKLLEFI